MVVLKSLPVIKRAFHITVSVEQHYWKNLKFLLTFSHIPLLKTIECTYILLLFFFFIGIYCLFYLKALAHVYGGREIIFYLFILRAVSSNNWGRIGSCLIKHYVIFRKIMIMKFKTWLTYFFIQSIIGIASPWVSDLKYGVITILNLMVNYETLNHVSFWDVICVESSIQWFKDIWFYRIWVYIAYQCCLKKRKNCKFI